MLYKTRLLSNNKRTVPATCFKRHDCIQLTTTLSLRQASKEKMAFKQQPHCPCAMLQRTRLQSNNNHTLPVTCFKRQGCIQLTTTVSLQHALKVKIAIK
jgi:uncharacterized protein YjhX (UPF0386 family)